MSTGLHIEAKVPKGHVLDVAEAISVIFEAAHENRMDQTTVQLALETLQRGAQIEGVSVANCNLTTH